MRKFHLSAFSTFEAALSILLIGIFSSFLISYWQLLEEKYNISITKMKANYIRKAIEGYVARNGFLPCAADHNGVENDLKMRGYVPYKTLGINRYYAYDGFGNAFCYIVNEIFTLKKYQALKKEVYPIQVPQNLHPTLNRYHFCRLYRYRIMSQQNPLIQDSGDWMNFDDQTTPRKITMQKWNINFIAVPDSSAYDYIPPEYIFSIEEIYSGNKIIFDDAHIHNLFYNKNVRKPHDTYQFEYIVTKDKSNYQDVVVWILISPKKNNSELFESEKQYKILYKEGSNICEYYVSFKDILFWQSRFNLAAQIKSPCTAESMDYEGPLFYFVMSIDELYQYIEGNGLLYDAGIMTDNDFKHIPIYDLYTYKAWRAKLLKKN